MSKRNPPDPPAAGTETDDRFPSGEWTGYFLQPVLQGRQWMELHLTFRDGLIRGEGRDWVGEFLIKGRYQVVDGRCWWNKAYVGKHSVAYKGYNEGKGIWGTWEMYDPWRGGFHIWPIAMGDPTLERLSTSIELPAESDVTVTVEEVVAEPVAADYTI
jgi:hypothetical protein